MLAERGHPPAARLDTAGVENLELRRAWAERVATGLDLSLASWPKVEKNPNISLEAKAELRQGR